MKTISTKSPIKLLENVWRTSTPSQKKALLKARGLSQTWSQAKTIKEMVERGGGMIARDLLQIVRRYTAKNPHIKEVRFKK